MSRDLDARTGGEPIVGRCAGGEPVDEAEHFMTCPECGQALDMRDLGQVLYHGKPGHAPARSVSSAPVSGKVAAGAPEQ